MANASLSNNPDHWVKSFLSTTVVCAIIAALTKMIWTGPYIHHLMISFGFGYSSVLSVHMLAYFFPDLTTLIKSFISITIAAVIGTIHAHFWLSGYEGYNAKNVLLSVVFLGVVFTVVCFNYFYQYERKLIAEAELEKVKRKESERDKALVLSQLSQMQSQIEPHFLFNTLANISALIETDSDKAKSMLNKLTDLLRANIKETRETLTTIEQEIKLIDAYLGIQQIRLGERLKYQIDYDDTVATRLLPPLLIQPLVENAIVHGIEPKPGGGKISITLEDNGDSLNIVIDDDGQGISGESVAGHGIGLNNIRHRLKMLFDDSAVLTIAEKETGGVKASVSLSNTTLNHLKQQTLRNEI